MALVIANELAETDVRTTSEGRTLNWLKYTCKGKNRSITNPISNISPESSPFRKVLHVGVKVSSLPDTSLTSTNKGWKELPCIWMLLTESLVKLSSEWFECQEILMAERHKSVATPLNLVILRFSNSRKASRGSPRWLIGISVKNNVWKNVTSRTHELFVRIHSSIIYFDLCPRKQFPNLVAFYYIWTSFNCLV